MKYSVICCIKYGVKVEREKSMLCSRVPRDIDGWNLNNNNLISLWFDIVEVELNNLF